MKYIKFALGIIVITLSIWLLLVCFYNIVGYYSDYITHNPALVCNGNGPCPAPTAQPDLIIIVTCSVIVGLIIGWSFNSVIKSRKKAK